MTRVEVDEAAGEASKDTTPTDDTEENNDEETLPSIVKEGKDFRIEIPDRVCRIMYI